MESRFVVKTTLRKEDARALARQQLSIQLWFLRICSAVLLLFLVLLWISDFADKYVFTAVTAAVLLGTIFLDRIVGAGFYKSANRALGELTYAFGEESIHISCASQSNDVPYGAFIKLVETKGHYFLYLQARAAYILPKTDFVAGDAGAFSAFIAEKTDLPVKKQRF